MRILIAYATSEGQTAKIAERLAEFLPAFSSIRNPIDMTFTRDVRLYGRCIETLKDQGIDFVIAAGGDGP